MGKGNENLKICLGYLLAVALIWYKQVLSYDGSFLLGKGNISLESHTVKFLDFWMPENFAVIYLKFKQRSQILGYFIKKIQMELQTV